MPIAPSPNLHAMAPSGITAPPEVVVEGEPVDGVTKQSEAPPQALNVRLVNCVCGADVWLEYEYFGGVEANSLSTWWRSRSGRGTWEHIDADNKNKYTITAEDLHYQIRCILTPVRQDGVRGEPVEVSEYCGLMDDMRSFMVERLLAGTAAFPVEIVQETVSLANNPPTETSGLSFLRGTLTVNHKSIYLTTSTQKWLSAKWRKSTEIRSDANGLCSMILVPNHHERERVYRFRTSPQYRVQLILTFRLFHGMAMDDITPEIVGPEVASDWRKGKFEQYHIEMRKRQAEGRQAGKKPNCHHRLRRAFERDPPSHMSYLMWRGPVNRPLSEDAVAQLREEERSHGRGWIAARDTLLAIVGNTGTTAYQASLNGVPSVGSPRGAPLHSSRATLASLTLGQTQSSRSGNLATDEFEHSFLNTPKTFLNHSALSSSSLMDAAAIETLYNQQIELRQQLTTANEKLNETSSKYEQLQEEMRSLRAEIGGNRVKEVAVARGEMGAMKEICKGLSGQMKILQFLMAVVVVLLGIVYVHS